MTGRTVLVTGVAGFIGAHAARALLSRGDRVVGIDNLNAYYPVTLKRDRLAWLAEGSGDAFRFVEGDIADARALDRAVDGERIDAILHLAAQAGVRHSIDNPRAYVQSNLVGHVEVLELARRLRCGHMVYASSSSVYGANRTMPFRETDRVDRPVSLYAATKRADELISQSYAHLYGLPQTGLRFFTVYGPLGRPDMAMWLFTSAVIEGRPIRLFNHGDMQRDFTEVDDIVAGVLGALDRPPDSGGPGGDTGSAGGTAPHRIWNIGNNRPEPLEKLVSLIERACGRTAIRRYEAMQDGDVQATFADIDAIHAATGFAPRTTLDEGVPRFVAWYRRYHGSGAAAH